MELLLRLLIISFPLVFAGALFWPAIEDRFVSPTPIAEESEFDDFLVLPDTKTKSYSKHVPKNAKSTETVSVAVTDSGIYRWVDEDGRVVFSDRPTHKGATAHTLVEIGTITGLDIPHSRRVVSVAASTVETTPQASQQSYRARPDFEFSNISAGQKHGYVMLSGRVSRGYRCKRLKVTATATSDRGRYVRGHDIIKSRGSGSSLYEIKPGTGWNGNGRRPQWDAGRVSAICLD